MGILDNLEAAWDITLPEQPNLTTKIFSETVCADCQQTTDKSDTQDKPQDHADILAGDDKSYTDLDKT